MPTEEGQKLRHACTTCSRSFTNKRDLVKHQYMHREKPKFSCAHCNKSFTTESNYKRHLNAVQNSDKKRYSCGNCGRLFRRLRDLEGHHESEHKDDKVFRCKICQAEFSWHENLIKHEQVHKVSPHVCSVCSREFIDMTSLLVHRRSHHPPTTTEQSKKAAARTVNKSVAQQQQQPPSEEKPFMCPICGRGFKFDFSYQAHLDAHVVPPDKEKSDSHDQMEVAESSSNASKPVYVQMDSEGIIDLPAFSNPNNEEVEIIVEVGNVTSTVVMSSDSSQNLEMMTKVEEGEGDSGAGDSEMKERVNGQPSNATVIPEQSADVADCIDDSSDTQQQGSGVKGIDGGRYYETKKEEETEGPPKIERMDVDYRKTKTESNRCVYTPENLYYPRPKKTPKRKRERTPFQFNCVMTDDKPFVCSICDEAFRWEISLQVHTKAHTDGKIPGIRKMYTSYRSAGKKKGKEKVKNENKQETSGVKRSRIVYRRDSSEEEEDEEDEEEEEDEDPEDQYAFRNEPDEGQEEEEEGRGCHGNRWSDEVMVPENSDNMLQEYLAGGKNSLLSPADGDDHDESEQQESVVVKRKTNSRVSKSGKQSSHKEDGWKRGKAILRKKRTWQSPNAKSSGDVEETAAAKSKDDDTDGQNVKAVSSKEIVLETSENHGSQLEVKPESDQQSTAACLGEMERDAATGFQGFSVMGVIGSYESLPAYVTATDDRVVMAAAYSVNLQPNPDSVMLQNGFTQDPKKSGELQVESPYEHLENIQSFDYPIQDKVPSERQDETVNVTGISESLRIPAYDGVESDLLKTESEQDVPVPLLSQSTVVMENPIQLNLVLLEPSEMEVDVQRPAEDSTSRVSDTKPDLTLPGLRSDVEAVGEITSHEPGGHLDCVDERFGDKNMAEQGMTEEFINSVGTSACKMENSSSEHQRTGEASDNMPIDMCSTSKTPGELDDEDSLTSDQSFVDRGKTPKDAKTVSLSKNTQNTLKNNFSLLKKDEESSVVIPEEAPPVLDEADVKLRRYKCVRCDKSFSCVKSFETHRKLHMSVKSTFECAFCSKKFITSSSLDRHLTTHMEFSH